MLKTKIHLQYSSFKLKKNDNEHLQGTKHKQV